MAETKWPDKMMSLELFHFLRPYWLLLLPVLFVLLWLMLKRRLSSRSWEAICDEQLLPYMLIGGSSRARYLPIILIGSCALLAIFSLAGPVWNKLPQPVFNKQMALVIALDLSHSMDSNDISPSRLSRARFKVADILNQHGEGQVALLVYAGDAFTVTPLTDDMETIASQLPALVTDIMPSQGNRTDLALEKAEELLKGAGHNDGDILLVTDEIELEAVQSVATQLKQEGYRISVLGIGSEHGAPVILSDGSFLKDNRGEIVIPVLDETPMLQLVQLAGGNYRRMSPDDSDIQVLVQGFGSNATQQEGEASEFETDVWQEHGPWLLLLVLPLAALAFRRGYLVVLLILILPLPEPVHAFDWNSMWLRSDQRGRRELDAGNAERAAELFNDPAWKAAARYRMDDYQGSIDELEKTQGAEALYNQGNALARLGKYEEAIANYDKVLEQMPEHEDAAYNKSLLEKELEKQQQQKQQEQKDNQDKQDQDKQDQDKENQEQQKQDEQQQENQDKQQDKNSQQQDSQQQDQNSQEQQDKETQQNQQQKKQDQQQSDQKQDKQEMTPEEKQKQESEEAKEEKSKPEKEQAEKQDKEEQQQLAARQEEVDEEQKQATEQWLRRIPDDPAGLLRRKFRYQYQQQQSQQSPEEKKW